MNRPHINLPHRPKCLRYDGPRVAEPHFEIKALAEEATITIFDVIGFEVTAGRIAGALRQIGDKPVTLIVNSPGGDYFEGVSIYNLLRAHSKPVTAQVIGVAASAASIVVMAAERIEMARNAELMIHDPWMLAIGNADAMAAAEAFLRKLNAAAAQTYAERTGLPIDTIAAMMAEEAWLSADQALNLGFADELLQRDAEARPATVENSAPQSKRELETQLRGLGFAKAAAERIAGGGWSALGGRADPETLQAVAAAFQQHGAALKAVLQHKDPI